MGFQSILTASWLSDRQSSSPKSTWLTSRATTTLCSSIKKPTKLSLTSKVATTPTNVPNWWTLTKTTSDKSFSFNKFTQKNTKLYMDLRLWSLLENKTKSCLILETGKILNFSTHKRSSDLPINLSIGLRKTKSPTNSFILMGSHWDVKPSLLTIRKGFGKSGSVSTTNTLTGAAGLSTSFPIKSSIFQVRQRRKERNWSNTLATTGLTRDFLSSYTREKCRESHKICLRFSRSKRVNSLQWMTGRFRRRWCNSIGNRKNCLWNSCGNLNILGMDFTLLSLH